MCSGGGALCVTVILFLPKSQRLMSPRLRIQLQFTTNLQLEPPPVLMSHPLSHTHTHTYKQTPTQLFKHMNPTGLEERYTTEVWADEGQGWCFGWLCSSRGQQQMLPGDKVGAAAEGKLWPRGHFQLRECVRVCVRMCVCVCVQERRTRLFITLCRQPAPPRSRWF